MKVEFNGNTFSAEMDSNIQDDSANVGFDIEKLMLKSNGAFVFGLLSLVISLCNMPFGLFMNFSTKILAEYLGSGLPHWVSVLFAFSSVTLALSLVSGVFSVVCFAKSTRRMVDTTGLIFSIISFVMVCFCFVMNILGIVAW